VRKFVIRREVQPKNPEKKPYTKAPKIQRLGNATLPIQLPVITVLSAFHLVLALSACRFELRLTCSHTPYFAAQTSSFGSQEESL